MTFIKLEVILLPALDQGGVQLLHNVLQVNRTTTSLKTLLLLLLLTSFLDQAGNLGLGIALGLGRLPGGDLDQLLVQLLQQVGLVPGEHDHLAQGLPACHHNCMFERMEGKS